MPALPQWQLKRGISAPGGKIIPWRSTDGAVQRRVFDDTQSSCRFGSHCRNCRRGYGVLRAASSARVAPAAPAKPAQPDIAGRADAVRTSVPKSIWDKAVAKAVQNHCYLQGMSEEEVIRAVGPPTQKNESGGVGATWTWLLPPGKCLKYQGDECVERQQDKQIVFFSAAGNAEAIDVCQTLSGKFVIFDLLESVQRAEREQAEAIRAEKRDAQAMKRAQAAREATGCPPGYKKGYLNGEKVWSGYCEKD